MDKRSLEEAGAKVEEEAEAMAVSVELGLASEELATLETSDGDEDEVAFEALVRNALRGEQA